MADRRKVKTLAKAALATALVVAAFGAEARVQPYQITRLITFKTACQIDKVEERPGPGGKLHFIATCENVSFYPDGVDVTCADPDDDRSCETTTRAKSFDNLHLLNPAR